MKTLRSQLLGWMKHWWLASGVDGRRDMLTSEAKREEKTIYDAICNMIKSDSVISPDATPITIFDKRKIKSIPPREEK